MVAVVHTESAPPSGVGICCAVSERLGDRCLYRPLSYPIAYGFTESGRMLSDVPSMAVSGEATAASVEMKSTLVARVIVSQNCLHAP